MLPQRLYGGVLACQLGFGKQRVHLPVTDTVQELRLTPALALWHQMMAVGLRWRDQTGAQRTNHDGAFRCIQGSSCCREGPAWDELRAGSSGAAPPD